MKHLLRVFLLLLSLVLMAFQFERFAPLLAISTLEAVEREALSEANILLPALYYIESAPASFDLRFEQVMADESLVDIEIPYLSDTWRVPQAQVWLAPLAVDELLDILEIKVTLVDAEQARDLSSQILQVAIVEELDTEMNNRARIVRFASSSSDYESQGENLLIPIEWRVRNRPAEANLVFEQVLADGRIINVEGYRASYFVGDSGSGQAIAHIEESEIILQIRLVDLTTGIVLDSVQLLVELEAEEEN